MDMSMKLLIDIAFFAAMLCLVIGKDKENRNDNHNSPNPTNKCPCRDPSWCNPIKDINRKEVFVFSIKNDSSHWMKFDWSKVTTVVMDGYHSDELMCLAHALNARVSYYAKINIDFKDPALRKRWIGDQINYMQQHFIDGLNFDYESSIAKDDTTTRNAYTSLVSETSSALKKIMPYSQISVDVAWRMNQDDRYYDYVGLANASDFLFVMSYDEQSQIFGECLAMPNAGVHLTLEGLQGYINAGIKEDRLVLGVPWYGYIYSCVKLEGEKCYLKRIPFHGAKCSDAAGKQYPYSYIVNISNSTSVKWNATSSTPYFTVQNGSNPYQVQFDNPQSLLIKYNMAVKMNLRGVGMWAIDFLNYEDTPAGVLNRQQMFGALPRY